MATWCIDNSWFAREELDPGAFDGQEYRAYNVLPDALLVNFQSVNFSFRPDPARRTIEILSDPVLAEVEIDNKMRLFRWRVQFARQQHQHGRESGARISHG